MSAPRYFVRALVAGALAASASGLSAETFDEQKPITDIDLRVLADAPTAYLDMRVKFRCAFITLGDLYAPFHTIFVPESYLNVAVWDDEDRIWYPEVRANPIDSIYVPKGNEQINEIMNLGKYRLMDVVGVVKSDYRQQPWVEVQSVDVLPPEYGQFSDITITHLQQAASLRDGGQHELAAQGYREALEESLPPAARLQTQQEQAENLMSLGEYERAAEVLDEALAFHSSLAHPPAAVSRARLHYLEARARIEAAEGEDDFQLAIDHARRAIELDPGMGDAYAVLGIALSGIEAYDEARLQCQRAILMQPDNAEIRWYLGRILDRQGVYDEAIAVLKRAIDLSPKDDRFHKSIANVYVHRAEATEGVAEDDLVTALREYDIAIRLNPQDADLYYRSGQVIAEAAEAGIDIRLGTRMVPATMEQAAQRWESCLAIDPDYLGAHRGLARYYRDVEQHDDAIAHYRDIIRLQPEERATYHELGHYLWRLDRHAEAAEVFAEYHALNPDDVETLYALGRISYEQQSWAQSAAWYQQLLREDRGHGMAHADLADVYRHQGEWREAEDHAREALEHLAEDQTEAQHLSAINLGWALWEQDRPAQALAAWDGAVGDGDPVPVQVAYGWALLHAGDKRQQEALKLAARLEKQGLLKQPRVAEFVAWAVFEKGEPKAAETILRRIDSDEAWYAYRLGMALYAQGEGRYQEAQPMLEQAEDWNPRAEHLRQVSRRLDRALDAIEDHRRAQERAREKAERAKRKAEKSKG